MKTVYVVRHAKSSWDDFDLPDSERPLNDRGKRDAPIMAERLKERGVTPDLWISSDAKRAFSTAKRFAKVLGVASDNIIVEKKLYHAGTSGIFKVLKSIPEKHQSVMIFGHNPGLTEFVNEISSSGFVTDNIPTCGIVALQTPTTQWSSLQSRTATVKFFDYPKKQDE